MWYDFKETKISWYIDLLYISKTYFSREFMNTKVFFSLQYILTQVFHKRHPPNFQIEKQDICSVSVLL